MSCVIVSFFIFGGPAAICGIVTQWFKHKEQMQDKLNEQLRLQIQLEEARHERLSEQGSPLSADPFPKETSWDDHDQTGYEMGYQQITRPPQ